MGACGIIHGMKALQSPLAKAVLADPKAGLQLRHYLATKSSRSAETAAEDVTIEVTYQGRKVRVRPMLVPKAA